MILNNGMKAIDGYNGYFVTEEGLVFSSKSNRFLKFSYDKQGYKRVGLSMGCYKTKTIKIHRLVAQAFIPNPENKGDVNHIDGNKSNNHYSNLEWCSAKENIIHAYKNGLNISHMTGKFDILHPNSIKIAQLSICGVNQINVFNSVSEASRQTKINRATINECINNKRKSAGGYKWQKI